MRSRTAAVAVIGLAVSAVVVGFTVWYTTRLTSVRIINDTPVAATISSCGNDVLRIDAGTSATEQVSSEDSRLGCDVYAPSRAYLGCLVLTRGGKLRRSVPISELRRNVAEDSC